MGRSSNDDENPIDLGIDLRYCFCTYSIEKKGKTIKQHHKKKVKKYHKVSP